MLWAWGHEVLELTRTFGGVFRFCQKVAVSRRICCSSEQIVCLLGIGDANAAQGQATDGMAWEFEGSPATLYNGHR